LELDSHDADAHASVSALKFYKGDMQGAEAELRTAIELKPKDTYHHAYYASLLGVLGRLEEALREARIALDLAPFDRYANDTMAWILIRDRKYERAIGVLSGVLEFDPAPLVFHSYLGQCYMGTSQFDRAVDEFRKVAAGEQTDGARSNLACALARSGRTAEATQILDALVASSSSRQIPYASLTQIQVALGRVDEAFELWERAYEEGDQRRLSSLRFALTSGPEYDGLRGEPRFQAFLAKLEHVDGLGSRPPGGHPG